MQNQIKDIQTQEIDVLDAIDQTESSTQMTEDQLHEIESEIVGAMNTYDSPYYYALHMETGNLWIYPTNAHPLATDGECGMVFCISAIDDLYCNVEFLDKDGNYLKTEECEIEGLAAFIENDMIACGYKA
jgi:hypothetical protein